MGKRFGTMIGVVGMIGVLLALSASPVGAAGLVARVVGSGIQFDGNGFYPGELVQINGIHYDGTTVPYGPATANNAGAITGVVPYSDTALYQIDARGYGSGMHAVSNITGALPYPVVPPGYPYVTPTYPYYDIGNPTGLPPAGGYTNTGYPYTGQPYGSFYPGPGFNYPVPPSGVVAYPYPNVPGYGVPVLPGSGFLGAGGGPILVPGAPYAIVGSPYAFTGTGFTPGAPISLYEVGPDGANHPAPAATASGDGSFAGSLTFPSTGSWRLMAQAPGMNAPISVAVQVNTA